MVTVLIIVSLFFTSCLIWVPAIAAEVRVPLPVAIAYFALAPILGGGAFVARFVYKQATSADLYRVWYGTNRKPSLGSARYYARDEILHYGTCVVAVPKAHRFGSTGTSGFVRILRRFMRLPDDSLTVKDVTERQH
jgi:hypothetical protein